MQKKRKDKQMIVPAFQHNHSRFLMFSFSLHNKFLLSRYSPVFDTKKEIETTIMKMFPYT